MMEMMGMMGMWVYGYVCSIESWPSTTIVGVVDSC
jgi:hypothetical protein